MHPIQGDLKPALFPIIATITLSNFEILERIGTLTMKICSAIWSRGNHHILEVYDDPDRCPGVVFKSPIANASFSLCWQQFSCSFTALVQIVWEAYPATYHHPKQSFQLCIKFIWERYNLSPTRKVYIYLFIPIQLHPGLFLVSLIFILFQYRPTNQLHRKCLNAAQDPVIIGFNLERRTNFRKAFCHFLS